MKKLILLLICIACLSPVFSPVFSEEYSKIELEDKVAGFTKMKNSGTGLLIGGLTLDSFGTILFITGMNKSGNDTTMDANGNFDGDVQAIVGWYSLVFGIPATIAGAVIHRIGRKKTNEYTKRLGFKASHNSMSIVYNF